MRSSFKAAGWKDPAALHRQARAIHSAGAPENLTQLPFLYQKGAEYADRALMRYVWTILLAMTFDDKVSK